jgi:glucokinase
MDNTVGMRSPVSSGGLALGVDLGGTKLEVAVVDPEGRIVDRLRRPTDVKGGPAAVLKQIVGAVTDLQQKSPKVTWAGIGIGVAGQIDSEEGLVRFAPNLDWKEVPLGSVLKEELRLRVIVTNDVRSATWGEWLFGAGQGCNDLLCLFVGTGIGGGVVMEGRMLKGCSNTAGELGHITLDMHGPPCRCGNRGCLEALAGGWAIGEHAQRAAAADPAGGRLLLEMAGGEVERITAEIVQQATRSGDPLARRLMEEATEALIAGATSLINAFNPCRLILSGGVIDGMPELITRIESGLRQRALSAATTCLEVLPARLGNEAGVVGAAALVYRGLPRKGHG